jgi:hypothetical protein
MEGNDAFDVFVAAHVRRHRGIAQQCFSILSSSLSSRMTTPHFPLIVVPPAPGVGSGILSGPSAPPMGLLERSALAEHPPEGPSESAETPANSTRSGSFYYDRVRGRYPMEWAGPAEFEVWRQEEELAYSIKLIPSNTVHGGKLWTLKWTYVCSHQPSGGPKKYQKKFPDRQWKIESKKTGCQCRIVIKSYPHTSAILGCYMSEHDHEIGLANIAYTRMSRVVREKIKYKLLQKIDPREIVHNANFNFGGGPNTVTGTQHPGFGSRWQPGPFHLASRRLSHGTRG